MNKKSDYQHFVITRLWNSLLRFRVISLYSDLQVYVHFIPLRRISWNSPKGLFFIFIPDFQLVTHIKKSRNRLIIRLYLTMFIKE